MTRTKLKLANELKDKMERAEAVLEHYKKNKVLYVMKDGVIHVEIHNEEALELVLSILEADLKEQKNKFKEL